MSCIRVILTMPTGLHSCSTWPPKCSEAMRSNTSNLETWFDWTMGNMPRTRNEIPVAMSEPPLKCKTATVHFCWTDLFLRLFFLVVQSFPKLCTPKRVSPGPGMLAMPTISLWDDAWWDHCLHPAWNVSLSLSNKFEIVLQASHRAPLYFGRQQTPKKNWVYGLI